MCVNRPVNFGGLGCRRAEDIALPSFLASMNSVGEGELVETILSRINIADTNELAEAVESSRRASGDAPLPDDPSRLKAWDLPILERNWENMLRVADQVCRARLLATAQREGGAACPSNKKNASLQTTKTLFFSLSLSLETNYSKHLKLLYKESKKKRKIICHVL